jgi:glycosyltransferase involved in cell wall biosynthesis
MIAPDADGRATMTPGSGRRMRIAHIGGKGLPSRGGTERVIEAIAVRHAVDHDVTVYGSKRVCSSAMFHGVRVIAVPVPRGKYAAPVVLDLFSAVRALFGRYDVVQVHGSENAFVIPLLRLRYRVVSTNHGRAYELQKWGSMARRIMRMIEGGSVRWASEATCVAVTQAERLEQTYGTPVRYIPNGVDCTVTCDVDAAAALLATYGLQPNGYVMFAAARVDPTKGCLTLIRAWRASGSDLPLLIVGDLWHAPGHEAELRAAAEGANVTFIPRTEDKELLLGLVASAALFVFPSTIEAMSMMLLEAVSVGARVLASDIPENVRVLPDGFPVFRAGDEADLARAMDAALAEPADEALARWGSYANTVREIYDWDRIADEYLSAYRGE